MSEAQALGTITEWRARLTPTEQEINRLTAMKLLQLQEWQWPVEQFAAVLNAGGSIDDAYKRLGELGVPTTPQAEALTTATAIAAMPETATRDQVMQMAWQMLVERGILTRYDPVSNQLTTHAADAVLGYDIQGSWVYPYGQGLSIQEGVEWALRQFYYPYQDTR